MEGDMDLSAETMIFDQSIIDIGHKENETLKSTAIKINTETSYNENDTKTFMAKNKKHENGLQ